MKKNIIYILLFFTKLWLSPIYSKIKSNFNKINYEGDRINNIIKNKLEIFK